MEPLEYLRILRRRKWFVALAVLVGLVAGWVTAPGADAGSSPKYQATHTLIVDPSVSGNGNANANTRTSVNLGQTALIVTTGVIPQNVATKLGNGADPISLARKVKATPNPTLGTIDITATDSDPRYAVELADAFAQALVDDLSSESQERWEARRDALQTTLRDLDSQMAALQGTFNPAVASPARSQFQTLQSQFDTATTQLNQLNATGPAAPTLSTLQSARAITAQQSGLRPPDSKPARALLLGAIGLALGIGLAFAAERLETRLTTKRSAESAFGLPVVAEIPNLPKARRHQSELMTASQPAAPFVEAYRGLRTMVLLRSLDQAHDEQPATDQTRRGRVLVVVSPGAGEGKTTTAAHTAALLAEAGNSVLVISADFRRPKIHELFAVRGHPGLSEVLAQHNPVPLRSLDLSTPVRGVKLLPSGLPVDNPAALLNATVELMRGARPLFDYIVVDTAPLLVANDASELIRAADMVLVVARSHRTSIDACERSAELLRRIDAPVIGAVLVGASDMPTAYRYYRYRYYGASSPPTLMQRLFGKREPSLPARIEEPPEPAPTGERRRRRQQKRERPQEASAPRIPEEVPAVEWGEPAATNGAGDHEPVDDSVIEVWQEFKERR